MKIDLENSMGFYRVFSMGPWAIPARSSPAGHPPEAYLRQRRRRALHAIALVLAPQVPRWERAEPWEMIGTCHAKKRGVKVEQQEGSRNLRPYLRPHYIPIITYPNACFEV